MDNSIVQMIVDILRRGKENQALNRGGPTNGAGGLPVPPIMPQAREPRHDGLSYDDIVSRAQTGQ